MPDQALMKTAKSNIFLPDRPQQNTYLRTLTGSVVGAMLAVLAIQILPEDLHSLITGVIAAAIGILAVIPFILKEIRLLLRL